MSGYLERVGLRGAGLLPGTDIRGVASPDRATAPDDLGAAPLPGAIGVDRAGEPPAEGSGSALTSARAPERRSPEEPTREPGAGPGPEAFRDAGHLAPHGDALPGGTEGTAEPEPPSRPTAARVRRDGSQVEASGRAVSAGVDARMAEAGPEAPPTPRPPPTRDAHRPPRAVPIIEPTPGTATGRAAAEGDGAPGEMAAPFRAPAPRPAHPPGGEVPVRTLLPDVAPAASDPAPDPEEGGSPERGDRTPREVTVHIDTISVARPPRRRPPVFRAPPPARPDFGGLELTRRHLDRPPV